MKISSKNRLIIMAHPDDPELACGGTIAQWIKKDTIVYVIVSCGEKGTWDKNASPYKIAQVREKEATKAAKFLGAKKVMFLRHPDGNISNAGTLKIELAALIRHFRPYTIVTHDPWIRMFHPDHRATAHAVIDAVMIARDWHFFPFLDEVGLKAHRAKELLLTPTDKPSYINDITRTYEKKIAAIKYHKSQLKQLPGWEKRITMRAIADGKTAGYKYGEAFFKMRI